MEASAANLTALRSVLREVGPGLRRAGDHDRDGRAAERAQLRAGLSVGAVESARSTRSSSASILAPALSRRGSSTKIMLGTMSNGDNGSRARTWVVTTVMGDPTAKGIVKVIGLQWGMLDIYEANPASVRQHTATSRSGRPSTSAATTRGTRPGTRRTWSRRPTIRPTASSPGATSATPSKRASPPTTPGTWCSTGRQGERYGPAMVAGCAAGREHVRRRR